MKFTDSAIRALPPPPVEKDYWRFDSETQGWGVRVTASSKIFYYQARDGHGQLRERIGPFPAIPTAKARKIVKTLAGKVAAGADLRAEKAAKKAKLAQARADDSLTFGDLISAWEEAHRSKRRSRYVKATAGGARNAFAHLLDQPAASITPEQLEGVWKSLTDLPSAAHVAGARARTLYRWALKTRRLENDPTQRTVLAEKPGKRQNFLTGEEARVVWRAAGTLPAPYGPLIKLLLASAVRLREAAEAPWTEFSGDLAEWTISRERMKLNEVHVVWLPLPVREMLDGLPRFLSTDLVFTSDGRRAVTGFTDLKKRLDKALESSGVKPFRLHDFRRSVTTWLVRDGTDPIVADRLLAHSGLPGVSSVASTYNVYKYEAGRRAALERWVNFLVGEEVQTSSIPPQLLLPTPDSEAVSKSRTAIPSLGTVENPSHEEGAFETVGAERSFIADFAPAAREARARETSERFAALMAKIAGDYDVIRTNIEIHKSRLTPAFRAEYPENSNSKAIEALLYRAAELALNRVTLIKRTELDRRTEEASSRRDEAKKARAEQEAADAMGYEEYAREAAADAERLEIEASDWELIHQKLSPSPDDPRVVEYRSGKPSHVSSLAQAVMLGLRKRNVEIFGTEHPTWAAAYANAATGGSVSRFQRRRRRKGRSANAETRSALVDQMCSPAESSIISKVVPPALS